MLGVYYIDISSYLNWLSLVGKAWGWQPAHQGSIPEIVPMSHRGLFPNTNALMVEIG
jgi:hypothetical protein